MSSAVYDYFVELFRYHCYRLVDEEMNHLSLELKKHIKLHGHPGKTSIETLIGKDMGLFLKPDDEKHHTQRLKDFVSFLGDAEIKDPIYLHEAVEKDSLLSEVLALEHEQEQADLAKEAAYGLPVLFTSSKELSSTAALFATLGWRSGTLEEMVIDEDEADVSNEARRVLIRYVADNLRSWGLTDETLLSGVHEDDLQNTFYAINEGKIWNVTDQPTIQDVFDTPTQSAVWMVSFPETGKPADFVFDTVFVLGQFVLSLLGIVVEHDGWKSALVPIDEEAYYHIECNKKVVRLKSIDFEPGNNCEEILCDGRSFRICALLYRIQ